MERPKIEVAPASRFVERALETVLERLNGRKLAKPFHLFLSGGSTPKAIYERLAEAPVSWVNVHVWWGDERFVPHDHPDSNYRMAYEALLHRIELPSWQVHPWPILSTPELSAETYHRDLSRAFGDGEEAPDLQLLGLGDDGHTASIFPETSALENRPVYAYGYTVDRILGPRLTLTFAGLRLSRTMLFLVKGRQKSQAVADTLEHGEGPAAGLQGKEETIWLVDSEAAADLTLEK